MNIETDILQWIHDVSIIEVQRRRKSFLDIVLAKEYLKNKEWYENNISKNKVLFYVDENLNCFHNPELEYRKFMIRCLNDNFLFRRKYYYG